MVALAESPISMISAYRLIHPRSPCHGSLNARIKFFQCGHLPLYLHRPMPLLLLTPRFGSCHLQKTDPLKNQIAFSSLITHHRCHYKVYLVFDFPSQLSFVFINIIHCLQKSSLFLFLTNRFTG